MTVGRPLSGGGSMIGSAAPNEFDGEVTVAQTIRRGKKEEDSSMHRPGAADFTESSFYAPPSAFSSRGTGAFCPRESSRRASYPWPRPQRVLEQRRRLPSCQQSCARPTRAAWATHRELRWPARAAPSAASILREYYLRPRSTPTMRRFGTTNNLTRMRKSAAQNNSFAKEAVS